MSPEIIITNKLSRELINSNNVYTFISTRDLLSSELNLARENNINRYLLKQLNEFDKKEFFKKLDIFWNELIIYHFLQ